jgi:hypothetical protein
VSHQKALSQWEQQVSTHLGQLSRPQAHVLALWSYGMVLAKSCGITSVAAILAEGLGCSFGTLRQQLREWCYDAVDKKGVHRQEVDVTLCFGPLLGWIVSKWPPGECRLALGMDATTLADRFTVLCVSVLYRGCAIPVAWKLLRSGEKGAWQPYWKALFTCLQASVPKGWTVIVLADRGLYAPWLYRHLVVLGWHPLLRINLGGKVRPLGAERFDWLSTLVPKPGTAWSGVVDCFVERTIRCTLLACWQEGYADAWLVVTDLAAETANVVWYCMRSWIEGGFKDTKRGGWHWHQTKMTDPARASRLWLAIALATLWVVSVGGEADARQPVSGLETLPALHIARRKATQRSQPRMQSCFARGLQRIWVALLDGRLLLVRRFFPQPWPATLPPRKPPTKQRLPKLPLITPPANALPSPSEAVLC